jgi:SAM-dependent methyltransferase
MRKKFYDNYDEHYYEERIIIRSKKHIIRFIIFLKGNGEKNIKWLDIGCGSGHLVRDATEEGIDAFGVDVSKYSVDNAVVKDRVLYGSMEEIKFSDGFFDVVSAIDVVEHIDPKNVKKALFETLRVLKPSGLLILTTPNPYHGDDWIYDLTHVCVRPPKFWKEVLESVGFEVKIAYVPAFLKYYVGIAAFLPDSVLFWLEEPLRYILGRYMSAKGRLYILARKR